MDSLNSQPRSKTLGVTTGSRLHFGLFSVGEVGELPRFGGCGLMVRHPGNQIQLSQAEHPQLDEKLAPLIRRWNQKTATQRTCDAPAYSATVLAQAPRHCGFGSGTQQALALGLALSTWHQLDLVDSVSLSRIMERGKRSAIGTYGFFRGGFLIDRGKKDHEQLAMLDLNFDFPESWPVLVFNLKTAVGLHGPEEFAAFKQIPPSTRQHRDRMIDIAKNQIAPSVASTDYETFGDALFEYGRSSGSAYASIQGGDFHSPQVESLVYQIRDFGVPAVGQSSWGPCVFAITPDDPSANSLCQYLQEQYGDQLEITQTKALNRGAEIQWQDLA